MKPSVTEMVLVVLYPQNTTDHDAEKAVACTGMMYLDDLRIDLEPLIIGVTEFDESEYELLCPVGITCQKEDIILGGNNAKSVFALTATYNEGDAEAEQIINSLLVLLAEKRIGYAYLVFDEEYPFNPDTDIPDTLQFDSNGEERCTVVLPFRVTWSDGNFSVGDDEDDSDDESEPECDEPESDEDDDPKPGGTDTEYC